jgi:LmbE family N-acetylglucosaminyl deacetylase
MAMAGPLSQLVHEMQESGSAAVILSPHLDDAVLSCGALLAHLVGKCPVTVVTVFTQAAPPPWSLPARLQLRAIGVTDVDDFYEERRAEDTKVLAEIGAAVVHLGLRDAMFRRVGDTAGRHLLPGRWPAYPTFRFDIARGRVARSDAGLPADVGALVGKAVRQAGAGVLFAPLGVGRHVDHLITRQASHYLPAAQHLKLRTVYYSDFPYSEKADPEPGFLRRAGLVPHQWLSGRAQNADRIAGYRTQFAGLFPQGSVPLRPETYWLAAKDSATAT